MKKRNLFQSASDLFYTIMATVVMNVALQIIIYPVITRIKGESVVGDILYFVGIIYIVPQALGTALNNVRLMIRKECDATNRDFRSFLILLSAISFTVCGGIAFAEDGTFVFSLVYALFSVVYFLRVYVSVEFRLDLRIKEYFLYFCLISLGYIVGLGLYLLTDIWFFIFLCGECAALAYSVLRGRMLRNDGLSGNRTKITKILSMMLMSTVIRDCVNQFDKVIIKQIIGADTVTEYHVASLIAKTIQMLVQPINSLILTYLTVKGSVLSRKQLVRFSAMALGCGAVFYGICIVGTPIFVRLFYPNLYSSVIQYNYIVNLGLIIGFVSTMFMSVLLTQGKTAIQMTIQCVWGVAYILAAFCFVSKYMVWGLAYVTLIANTLKLIAATAFVFFDGKKKNNPQP